MKRACLGCLIIQEFTVAAEKSFCGGKEFVAFRKQVIMQNFGKFHAT
jgi:hypothetical protein